MKQFLLSTGTVIATYIGTFISLLSAGVSIFFNKQTKQFRNEIFIRYQSNEIQKLLEKGKKAKEIISKYNSKSVKTTNGLNESKDKSYIQEFLTEINENKHLAIEQNKREFRKKNKFENQNLKKYVNDAKKLLSENKYDDLLYCISDIISKLKELNDTILVRK